MEHVTPSRRDYRRSRRHQVSERLQRKYDYRGVKRAMGFALLAALVVYLSGSIVASIVNYFI